VVLNVGTREGGALQVEVGSAGARVANGTQVGQAPRQQRRAKDVVLSARKQSQFGVRVAAQVHQP
jgi:hypothetical protein